MDLEKLRSFISDSGTDLWTLIDTAISMASIDHENELKIRRDGIVQKLYASTCVNCVKKCDEEEEENLEQREILEIKNLLDDHAQDEKCLIDLLLRLVNMNTSFAALKETEIGRHVTKLRKHSSDEVRRLVKILVRKWKDTVDEWVRQNKPTEEATDFNDGSVDNGVKAISCYDPTPTKRKAEDNGNEMNDQEFHHAKRQRSQAMNISRSKNSIIHNNGDSVTVKYW